MQKEKQQLHSAGKFVLLIILYFAILSVAQSFLPENSLEKLTAASSNAVYSAFGISGEQREENSEIFVQIKGGQKIVFSGLCTGALETILLVSAIAATFEISGRKRIAGIFTGIACIFAFNIFRIVATTLAILNAPVGTAEFAHNVLFRIFLFIAITGLYAGWYNWAMKS